MYGKVEGIMHFLPAHFAVKLKYFIMWTAIASSLAFYFAGCSRKQVPVHKSSVSAAQPAYLPVTVKVSPYAPIPASVRHRVPTGVKSKFFGSIKSWPSHQETLIHIYNKNRLDPTNKHPQSEMNYYAPSEKEYKSLYSWGGNMESQRCNLEVFSPDTASRGKNLHLIQSIPFSYISTYTANSITSADALWLDVKQKRIPLLKVGFAGEAFFGTMGASVLFIFPKGISGKPIVQVFGEGSDSGSSWGSDFSGIDANGFLAIHSIHSTQQENKTTVMQWNGKAFIKTDEVLEGEIVF